MVTQKDAVTMRSLERAIDILEVLEDANAPLRLVDIASKTGLHIATTQRILAVLEARRRVERDSAGYRAGVALIFGAHAYVTTNPLVAVARPVLQELASRTSLTTSLFVRSGWHRAAVARVHGSRPLGYELPIGAKLPLYLGSGKTLISELTDEELDDFLAVVEPMVNADREEVSGGALRSELERIEKQGYHVSFSERQIGALSISAPVRSSRTSKIIGALTIGATRDDVSEKETEPLIIEVRRAAAAIVAT